MNAVDVDVTALTKLKEALGSRKMVAERLGVCLGTVDKWLSMSRGASVAMGEKLAMECRGRGIEYKSSAPKGVRRDFQTLSPREIEGISYLYRKIGKWQDVAREIEVNPETLLRWRRGGKIASTNRVILQEMLKDYGWV